MIFVPQCLKCSKVYVELPADKRCGCGGIIVTTKEMLGKDLPDESTAYGLCPTGKCEM